MNNHEIISILANSNKCAKIFNPTRRYFKIVDNYLKGRPISLIENKNYSHNPPRKVYLDHINLGFELNMDYDSPLFENRIHKTLDEMLYAGNLFAFPRFFKRLKAARETNTPLNETSVYHLMNMGSVMLKVEYPLIAEIIKED